MSEYATQNDLQYALKKIDDIAGHLKKLEREIESLKKELPRQASRR